MVQIRCWSSVRFHLKPDWSLSCFAAAFKSFQAQPPVNAASNLSAVNDMLTLVYKTTIFAAPGPQRWLRLLWQWVSLSDALASLQSTIYTHPFLLLIKCLIAEINLETLSLSISLSVSHIMSCQKCPKASPFPACGVKRSSLWPHGHVVGKKKLIVWSHYPIAVVWATSLKL